jgi:mono/diheme cytochrome c family protein
MADQPSFKPLQPSTYFDDHRSARPLVDGTVARGHLRTDAIFFTGYSRTSRQQESANQADSVSGGSEEDLVFVDEFPIPINETVLQHGFNRYMIYCVVCHDPLGTGQGKIVERGYTAPPSFHIERLRTAPVGRLFAVASEGYGSMPSYASQIPVEDRWAIIAYLRALQLSQHFPVDQLTPEMRQQRADASRDHPSEAAAP